MLAAVSCRLSNDCLHAVFAQVRSDWCFASLDNLAGSASGWRPVRTWYALMAHAGLATIGS